MSKLFGLAALAFSTLTVVVTTLTSAIASDASPGTAALESDIAAVAAHGAASVKNDQCTVAFGPEGEDPTVAKFIAAALVVASKLPPNEVMLENRCGDRGPGLCGLTFGRRGERAYSETLLYARSNKKSGKIDPSSFSCIGT